MTRAISALVFLSVGRVAWCPCRALLGIDRSPYAVGVTPLAAILAALTLAVFRRG